MTNDQDRSTFVYVTYIRTTPETLWAALIDPEQIRDYWYGTRQESTWEPGAAWRMIHADGRVADAGEIIEAAPPKRLAIKWRNEFRPELKAEGFSRCLYEIEPISGEVVKLTVTHTIDRKDSKLIEAVSGGWPRILSNLKSYLETGRPAMVEKV
ncbi:MAG: SRPBCC family protein [Hyphomonadaceae bacterium]